MGQIIEVTSSVVGETAVFDTDRSLTGQDGETFDRSLGDVSTFAGRLARRLFDEDPAIDHVYVQFNVVSVHRKGGWDEGSVRRAGDQIRSLVVFHTQEG